MRMLAVDHVACGGDFFFELWVFLKDV